MPSEPAYIFLNIEYVKNCINVMILVKSAISILQDMTSNLNQSGFKDVLSKNKRSKQDKPKQNNNRNMPNMGRNDADVVIESEFVLNHNGTLSSPIRNNKKATYVDEIVSRITEGNRVLILMRGLPGSGKSWLAKELVLKSVNMHYQMFVFSTDDFFMRCGKYMYNSSALHAAHEWNQTRVGEQMVRGLSPLIVDNTNIQEWEMYPYVQMALTHGYIVEVVESRAPWAFSDKDCAKKNSHNVPRAKIKEMLERYDRNITGNSLLAKLKWKYAIPPPVARNYPPVMQRQNYFALRDREGTGNPGVRDLMNFDDAVQLKPPQTVPENASAVNAAGVGKTRHFSIDDIFKCDEKVNADVLQAVLNPLHSAKLRDNSASCDGIYPKLNLESWGVKEEDITAWDVVEKIEKHAVVHEPMPQREQPTNRAEIETAETGTSTNCSEIGQNPNDTILVAKSRSILSGIVGKPVPISPKKVFVLDKSTMIDDDEISVCREPRDDTEQEIDFSQFSELVTLFPNVSKENLIDLYKKCNGDINWIGDLLLDDPRADLPPPPPPKPAPTKPVEIPQEPLLNATDYINGTAKLMKDYETYAEESMRIKKQLEECIDIGAEHYSPHVQQIKNWKHGKENPIEASNSDSSVVSPKSSPSGLSNRDRLSSDTDVTDLEDSDDLDEPDHTVELNLGESFAEQLESKFGDPNASYPKGFQPVVQIPISLARQLHAFYLESIYQQMEAQNQILESMIKEDEEFAKRLQEKENEMGAAGESFTLIPPIPDMKELMDEEMAKRVYKQQQDEWKNDLPDNIAYKLSKRKLIWKFPGLDENDLVEIFHAHGNCYQKTIEAIKATGIEESEPEEEFKDVAKKKAAVRRKEEQPVDEEDGGDVLSAQEHRQIAAGHIERRQELYSKAQTALKAGLTPVAQYYIEQAKEQTHQFELANSRAASAFLHEHSLRLKDADDTLDLHYLYVTEALSALDIFIDKHINALQTIRKGSAKMMIITGRGKHAADGRARIKPAVIKRLKKRSLK